MHTCYSRTDRHTWIVGSIVGQHRGPAWGHPLLSDIAHGRNCSVGSCQNSAVTIVAMTVQKD